MATTVLVSSAAFLGDHRDLAKKIAQAHKELTEWIRRRPGGSAENEFQGRNCSPRRARAIWLPNLIEHSWKRIAFTSGTSRTTSVQAFLANSVKGGFIQEPRPISPAFLRIALMSFTGEFQVVSPSKLFVEKVSKWFRTRGKGEAHALEGSRSRSSEGDFVCLVGTERMRQVDLAEHHLGTGAARLRPPWWPTANKSLEPGRRPDRDVPEVRPLFPLARRREQRACSGCKLKPRPA